MNNEAYRSMLLQAADIIDGIVPATEVSPEARRFASKFLLRLELKKETKKALVVDPYWDYYSGQWVTD